MAHQIVITSLEKTLTGGTGYGLAGATAGIPDVIRKKVLSLAAYGFVRRSPSPVNWVGWKLESAAGPMGVLGRIAEAPNDYSGRDNFLGHFLLVSPSEAAKTHPALILELFPWITTWKGPARGLEAPRLPLGSVTFPQNPSPWESVTGDAGWAGYGWDCLDGGGRFCFVHENLEDRQLRSLIIETLSMASAARAWNLSFSTHADGFPEGLRCAIQGTHAASSLAMRWDQEKQISLHLPVRAGQPAPRAPEGSSVLCARQGKPLPQEARQGRHQTQKHKILETMVESEAIPLSEQPPQYSAPPPMVLGPDPWRPMVTGVLGFSLGAICMAIPMGVAMIAFWPSRDKDNGVPPVAEKGANADPNPKKGDQNEGPKKDPAPDKGADPAGADAQANLEKGLKQRWRLLGDTLGLSQVFQIPEALNQQKAQWNQLHQQLVLFRTFGDWKADERALLRPDRFSMLVRSLSLEKPALPDPFSTERLNTLKDDPRDGIVWVCESVSTLARPQRSSALAWISFWENMGRVSEKEATLRKNSSAVAREKGKIDGAYWRQHREELKKVLTREDFENLDANFADNFRAKLDQLRASLEKYQPFRQGDRAP